MTSFVVIFVGDDDDDDDDDVDSLFDYSYSSPCFYLAAIQHIDHIGLSGETSCPDVGVASWGASGIAILN